MYPIQTKLYVNLHFLHHIIIEVLYFQHFSLQSKNIYIFKIKILLIIKNSLLIMSIHDFTTLRFLALLHFIQYCIIAIVLNLIVILQFIFIDFQ